MRAFDAVFVGSGINSLAGGALLARAGWRVCVLERSDQLGGAIRTAELTEPGFRHEVFASWHPLFTGSAAYAELKDELEARGLEYLNTDLPTATLFPDGESAFLTTSLEDNVAEFERHAAGDGEAWRRIQEAFLANAELAFGVLATELWSAEGLRLALRAYRRLGRVGLHRWSGELVSSARDWLGESFDSPRIHGLLAPWVLHTGLGPDAALSGSMTKLIAVALQLGGMPVPRGGGSRLVEALRDVIEDAGGECRTEAEAERVLVQAGRAAGVRLTGGETVSATRAVACSVTPNQLYGRLLADQALPESLRAEGLRFRFGRAEMQIHLALSERPRWPGDERLARTAIVHLTPGLDGVSRAVNEAERGLLPAEATIVCGQPLAIDESRAPGGSWILWLQLQELPRIVKGDAAGELDPGDGSWSEELRERYADRIQARLAAQIPNLERALLRRVVLSPAEIAAANINLVGGDIYAGALSLDQNLIWRPRPGLPGHRTPVAGLFHIGASTHPGPGLGAGSGYMVAKQLLRPPLPRRLLARVRR
ncbi:MAG TPA: NAD(P)/FAD-dependent oxidoreductase [Gaiellaceae bacterium]